MTDISDEAIRAYAANIFDLEDAREVTQSDLKDAWAHIREAHGKKFADSLKLAVKRARQDADKRAAADEVDAEAERIMSILSAPRATRAREIIEQFDADGVIIESTAARKDVPLKAGLDGRNTSQRETERSGGRAPSGTEAGSPSANQVQAAGTQAPPVDTTLTLGKIEGHSKPEAAMLPQTDPVGARNVSAGQTSVESPATITDLTQPNPICRDPGDCGVYASWHHPCLACTRAARAVA